MTVEIVLDNLNVTVDESTFDVDVLPSTLEAVEVDVGGVGPQGPKGDEGPTGTGYTHTQSSASTTWTVNHNLGVRPLVSVTDTGGSQVECDVVHTSLNQVVLYFNAALAGVARCF